MNKKGDESSGKLLWFILGIVMALVVAGLIGYWYFVIYNGTTNIIEMSPITTVDLKAQTCSASLRLENDAMLNSLCNQFNEVEIFGVKQYVVCRSDSIKSFMSESDKLKIDNLNCPQTIDEISSEFCAANSDKLKEDAIVNGQVCSYYS